MKQLELGEKYYTSAQSNIHVILPFINSTTSKDKYIYIYIKTKQMMTFWLTFGYINERIIKVGQYFKLY